MIHLSELHSVIGKPKRAQIQKVVVKGAFYLYDLIVRTGRERECLFPPLPGLQPLSYVLQSIFGSKILDFCLIFVFDTFCLLWLYYGTTVHTIMAWDLDASYCAINSLSAWMHLVHPSPRAAKNWPFGFFFAYSLLVKKFGPCRGPSAMFDLWVTLFLPFPP